MRRARGVPDERYAVFLRGLPRRYWDEWEDVITVEEIDDDDEWED
jgi:hypothetical protein